MSQSKHGLRITKVQIPKSPLCYLLVNRSDRILHSPTTEPGRRGVGIGNEGHRFQPFFIFPYTSELQPQFFTARLTLSCFTALHQRCAGPVSKQPRRNLTSPVHHSFPYPVGQ